MARALLALAFIAVTAGTYLEHGRGWALIVGGVLAAIFAVTIDVDGGPRRE